MAATVRVIEATGVDIEWETQILGSQALEKYGSTLPDSSIEAMRRNKVSLKGPIMTPIGKGFTSVNVGLRRAFDLYANLRPVKALPNVPCRYPELDLVIVRENTEGSVLGPRAHRHTRCSRELENYDGKSVDADSPIRLRICS